MAYDTKKFEAPNSNSEKQTETQRAETVVSKFFAMADKINPYMESERPKQEMFSVAGTETAQGNYDKAQRNLETGVQWDDKLRGAATEVNQLNQERIGAKPMSFDEAQRVISEYARNFEKMAKGSGGKQEDNEAAMDINNLVRETSELGVAGINKALQYIEGALKSKGNIANSILESETASREDKAEFLKDWQEKRNIRDALYQEKQKRAEQLEQSQQTTKAKTRERETAESLDAAKKQQVAKDQAEIKRIRSELGLDESEKSVVYKKITDANFEQYHKQKPVMFGGRTWRIDPDTPNAPKGLIVLHRDIAIDEAVSLAEYVKNDKGRKGGPIDTPNVKTKAIFIGKKQLESDGQWIIEKPPRSPQNPERQKEVDAVRALQARLISKEFAEDKFGEENLLMDVLERDAQRLNLERQDYEAKKKP
ncbi:MAG: hypothetical protein AAB723_03550 [Patescibacteria group bacterium]